MTTITVNKPFGIDLNPAVYTSPVVVVANVIVSNTGYYEPHPDAIYRHPGATTFFAIDNNGVITGTANGVYLAPGGSVTNAANASILAGIYDAVKISGGAGTVVNDGSIGVSYGYSGVYSGVDLLSGGSVTNGATASISATRYAVMISGGAGTVVNDGDIFGTGIRGIGGTAGSGIGVDLQLGGSVTNAATAAIIAANYAVKISGGAGTVVNDGYILGNYRYGGGGGGLDLLSGGSVTNASHGTIAGVALSGGPGTVVNDGSIGGTIGGGGGLESGGSVTNSRSASIMGASVGVSLSGGTLTNAGSISGQIAGVELLGSTLTNTGTISANGTYGVRAGVYLSGGTLTNAGSIIGSKGTAVASAGTGSNLLVLDPGFGFSGLVAGSTSSSNSIELASGSSTGTVAGLGSEFVQFGSIVFDAGAQWLASGVQSGLAGPISGFAQGDTIELTGDTAIGSSFVTGVLTLDLAGGGSATLDLSGTFTSASDFVVTNVAAGADVTVACFAAGTRILTAGGEVPVEELRFGDRVPTLGSRLAGIAWFGHRRIDCRRHTRPTDTLPVRVHVGAFGERLPARDLLLSPDHAVFVDGALVPVRHLINGRTVVQEQADEVTYYHVELATHDVVLAEGLPCDSYLDTGNRAAFVDGGAETLHGEDDLLTAASTSYAMARHIAS